MFYHNLNPVIFKLGFLEIRYYGLMYLLGIILSYAIVLRILKGSKIKITRHQLNDIFFYSVLGLIIGGRLGYCFIYTLPYTISHPLSIFEIWQGGMSFHSGFALALLFGWLYCRKHKIPFLELGDIIITPVPLALALGRVGNFINGELWGRPSSLPWAFYFPLAPDRGTLPRHPSQIYEVLKNIVIFSVLWLLVRKKHKPGTLLFSFILLYGSLRIIVEFFRQPEIIFLGVTMGQWLCIPMVLIGAGWLAKNYIIKK